MRGDLDVYVHTDGTIEFVHDDDLADLFDGCAVTVRRASHVEPAEGGGWTADLRPVGGPVLGPFPRRATALAAELGWLGGALARGRVTPEAS